MAKLFGTDGVRGEANTFLTPELAYRLGKAAAYVLKDVRTDHKAIIIGKDTRISGDMLEASLAAGICSMGLDAYFLGVCPTPAVAYLTKNFDFTTGVMISASHNPAIDNGIKFFDSNGFKLADEVEEKIEKIVNDKDFVFPAVAGDQVGRIYSGQEMVEKYREHLLNSFQMDLSGKTIVVDCANGSASFLMPEILKSYNCRVIAINNEPDGLNINLDCGSTHLEALKKAVLENQADLGIAHDGDSDRVLFVDHKGEEVDGDMIMAIIANDLKSRNKLKNNIIVGKVMSNLSLKK